MAESESGGLLQIITLNIGNEEQLRRYPVEASRAGWPKGAYESRGFSGESILVVVPSGKTMLIDAAWPSDYSLPKWGEVSYGKSPVLPFLRRQGIGTIDWMVVTHQHYDHIGGVAEIVRSKEVDVKALLWSPLPDDLFRKHEPSLAADCIALTHDLAQACADRVVPVMDARQGETIDLGNGVDCEVLAAAIPERETESYANNNSVVLRVTYRDFAMVLTGDAGFEQEKRIMADGRDLTSDVLKLGHHALAGATSEAWLQAVGATVGVSSMPRWLSEDERGLRVERQLERAGLEFYRTWEHGNVEVQTDGHQFWVTTER